MRGLIALAMGAATLAPVAAAACVKAPVIVYFEFDSVELVGPARAALDEAVSDYHRCGDAPVLIAGHTDRAGEVQDNVDLSQRLAATVRDYLMARGVAMAAIRTEAFGESRPMVATEDGVREPQNRRVEVTFGRGPKC